MSAPPKATFEDLALLSEDIRAEVIGGVIVEKDASAEHGAAQLGLGGFVARRFARKPGGRWPGGWWIGTEVEVEYETHEIYRHDLAGYRLERIPERLHGRRQLLRPDWACEILSPSNAKHDRVDKFRVLQHAGVPHYWLIDPVEKILSVFRLDGDSYRVALTATAGETVRAEPFEGVELRTDVLFGDAPDEE